MGVGPAEARFRVRTDFVEPRLDTGIDAPDKWKTIKVGATVLHCAADPSSVLVQLADLAKLEWQA